MCGILAIYGQTNEQELRELSKAMGHRGPDESGVVANTIGGLAHQRLSIMDLESGRQPLLADSTWGVHNGEIYNFRELAKGHFDASRKLKSSCDSEVIPHLYELKGKEFIDLLDGVFAFAILGDNSFLAARDPLGVKPLFYGQDSGSRWLFSSEWKVITTYCTKVEEFPPGSYWTPSEGLVRYDKARWWDLNDLKSNAFHQSIHQLAPSLEVATQKRLMSDAPLGLLLSGGLDSSLTAALAQKHSEQKLHSFSIGLDETSPDLRAAQQVARHCQTNHHEVTFDIEEAIAKLEKLIWHLESYDVTTIRAGMPMYLLSEYITDLGIKVVLSGEGSDEVFGGYLYFHQAPSTAEFHGETLRRLRLLHKYDLLRADRTTMAYGLEARVPFLDRDFLENAMTLAPELKRPKDGVEKWALRQSFSDYAPDLIPHEILWRQKEQFSDGVGYSWIDRLRDYAENLISDQDFSKRKQRFPVNCPQSKEAFLYRRIFEDHYGTMRAALMGQWEPRWQKNLDPSGRASAQHEKAR